MALVCGSNISLTTYPPPSSLRTALISPTVSLGCRPLPRTHSVSLATKKSQVASVPPLQGQVPAAEAVQVTTFQDCWKVLPFPMVLCINLIRHQANQNLTGMIST